MEGLAVAANIFSVIQLTGKVTSLGYRYIGGTVRASKDLQALLKELNSLVEVLNSLQGYVNTNPHSNALQKLNDPNGSLRGCIVELQRLQLKLEPKDGMRGVFQILKWPLQENETSQHIMRIERHKNHFLLVLTLNQAVSSREFEKDMRDTTKNLQNQSKALSGKIEAYTQGTDLAVWGVRNDVWAVSTAQNLWQQEEDRLRAAKKRDKVLNWLYPETIQQKHIEIQNRRRKNTGGWILETPELKGWIKGEWGSKLLWGYGIAGAGKTFLSSVVINHLQDQALAANYGIAHIYFDYKEQDRQKPIDVLASLVKQLTSRIPQIPTDIETLHGKLDSDNEVNVPTFEELYAAFLTVSKLFAHVYVILDALDECDQNNQRRELLPLFHRMGEDGTSLFMTSRQYPEDIQESFRNVSKMELSAKQEDIRVYVQSKINENPRAKRLVQQAKCGDRIISELVECSQGMFLIVRFHVEHLCRQPTAKHMLMELGKLQISIMTERPLDPTYDRAMEILRKQPRNCVDLAIKILSWLVKAQRTLTVEELRTAVSVEPNRYELDELDFPDKATLLDVCASLVTIDEHSHTIGLAHYTVQEYLVRKSIIPEDADFQLARACTTFLSFEVFAKGACTGEPDNFLEDRLRLSPFLKYAADHLSHHLHSCDESLTTDIFLRFLGSQGNVSSYLQAFCFRIGNGKPYPRSQHPLHVASAVGHKAATQVLLDNGADPSIADKYGRTPSYLAISRGHEAVTRLLLDRGADVTIPVTDGRTALHKAASRGFESVIRLLLEKGAVDVSVKENHGRTPLHFAASRGHASVVQLLLENQADLSVAANNGSTPLHMAAYRGHKVVVQLLIRRGAKLSVPDNEGVTALYIAASQGHEAVVGLLLDEEVNLSASGNNMLAALGIAARKGHQTVVKLLLERGALSVCRGHVRAPLHLTTSQAPIELLPENSSKMSTIKSWGRTALHEAAFGGHEKTAKLLLENGIDLSEVDYSGSTALHLAAYQGHEAVVRLLLDNGATTVTRCRRGRTALHSAASGGHQTIVSLLLERGADLSVSDQSGRTVLHDAASQGHRVVVQLLLEKGADLSISDWNGRTALHSAASQGHVIVVQLLLKKGIDVSIPDKNGWTALHLAALRRHRMVVQVLGAKLSIGESGSWTATKPCRIFRPLLVSPAFIRKRGLGYATVSNKKRRVVR